MAITHEKFRYHPSYYGSSVTAYVRSSATTIKTTESPTYTITLPPMVRDGDILVIFTSVPIGTLLTPPDGWSTLAATNITTVEQSGVYAKLGAATDAGGSAVFTLASPRRLTAFSVAVANAKQSTRYIVSSATAYGGAVTAQTAPSVTTGGANYLALASTAGGGTGQTVVPPPGCVELADLSTATGTRDSALSVASISVPSAGPTDTRTFTTSVASGYIAQQIAIPSASTKIQPSARAGSGQFVNPGTLVTLDGTGSVDPDGTISGYSWSCISVDTVPLTNQTTAQPTFVAPTTSIGPLTFQLVVTDNDGLQSSPATTGVIVQAVDRRITITRSRVNNLWV